MLRQRRQALFAGRKEGDSEEEVEKSENDGEYEDLALERLSHLRTAATEVNEFLRNDKEVWTSWLRGCVASDCGTVRRCRCCR